MSDNNQRSIINTIIITLVAVFFFTLGVREFLQQNQSATYIRYPDTNIPLTYPTITHFTQFLTAHQNQIIAIDALLSFDAATDYNQLVHNTCNYSSFLDPLIENIATINHTRIGLFSASQTATGGNHCTDTLAFSNLDTSDIKFIYGGTGTFGLPIKGLFRIDVIQENNATHFRLIQTQ